MQEIDAIFAAALDREPAERAAFLDDACDGDEVLRREVESLLANDIPESLVEGYAVQEATRLLKKKAGELTSVRIGRYQIIRSLGVGGMGRVYLGLDEQLNRQVAVKLLSNYDGAEEERMRRFRQEALAASALNHPNILTIYEIGEYEGANFITAEFVDGMTLRARMAAGALPLNLALDIAIQTASALSAAHNSGIVHRDIKPENVMVRADGLVKVLDFGIAKFTQAEGNEEKDLVETMPGMIIGTVAYMSPEQARGVSVDTRTDIWSLGVILYEMVAQRLPFWGNTPADVIAAVLERQPLPLSAHNPLASESLAQIVFNALQKERENRYQTAAELLTDLKQLKQKLEQAGDPGRSESEQKAADARTGIVATGQPNTGSVLQASTTGDGPTTTSSAEYVVDRIKHHKYAVLAVLVGLLVMAGFLAYRPFVQRSQIESIAVMPFVNEGGTSEVEYLSDGMTESLINGLSRLPNLSVKARSSVFRYKGKDVDPQRIASELSVQAILNGRVVQRGDNLTLYLSLVDARDGNQLWGEQYDRKVADLVSLQREIARDVSQKLRSRLSGAEEQKVTKDYTANTEAYQLYLKGRFNVFKLTPPEVKAGILYFQQAIQLDPNYALAYVGLADAYRSLGLGAEMSPTEFLPKSKAAAQRALEIDDSLAEAHTALGMTMFWYDWNWSAVENQFKRALELNPNSAETHQFYAHLLSNTGRHAEALAEIKRARELDPYSPFLNTLEGQFLLHAGKPDEALVRLRETFELAPSFWFPHLFASSAYIEKGMFVEAISEARRATELSSAQTVSAANEGYALAKLGKYEEARIVLDRLLKLSKERFVPPYHIAFLYNGLGQRNEAFAWLERGFEQRDPKMTFLKVEPKWNNLRDDPRFVDLMRRVGLSQ
jgi:serine/threonine protein kinase/Tfp pilus assembly protein PilF